MKNYNESDGVWRTIGGRRVFIRKGQSLSNAMIESGKFKVNRGTPEKKDYTNYKLEKDSNGDIIAKNSNGEEIKMLETKEYKKLAEDFADSLNERETKDIQDYVDCPGISGELNASTEDGSGTITYLYNTTNNNYFTTEHELAKHYKKQGELLEKELGIKDYINYSDWENENVKKWFKEKGCNNLTEAEDFMRNIRNNEYFTPEQIAKAKRIYPELDSLEQKRLQYDYGTPEYNEITNQLQLVRKKYGIEAENKSAYYYEQIAKSDTEKIFDSSKYNLEELKQKGDITYLNAKQLKELNNKDIGPYQYSGFTKRRNQIDTYINDTKNLFKDKGVKLDHDIILFRRGRESYEEIENGFKMNGVTSATYKDTLPKKMPSGLSFGGKEYYIIVPKGTSLCFAEKVIGRGQKSTPENEKSWNQVRRQHEVMLKPETSYKLISSQYIPGKNWDDGRDVVLLVAEEE